MEEKIVLVLNEMSEYLSVDQMKKLQEVILKTFAENAVSKKEISNEEYLRMFLDAKSIEGCSKRTIQYYKVTRLQHARLPTSGAVGTCHSPSGYAIISMYR